MPTMNRKSKRVTFIKGERDARRDSEEAMRKGLPIAPTAARHLQNALRKMNLMRYGKADL